MYGKMMNLFTADNTSGLYVAGYIQAMARQESAGVSVWRGDQKGFQVATSRLADMMALQRDLGGALPERNVYVYGLDPHDSEGLETIQQIDPGTVIHCIQTHVPAVLLLQLKTALCFCCPEDVEAACAEKISPHNHQP